MPFSGLRVLDLSDHAGALCSRLLADLGADVVRVEPPGGAPVRRVEPLRGGESVAHLYANLGKRVVTADVETDEGRAVLARLAEAADVIIDARSMAPSLVARSGVDPVEGAGRSAVVLRISPFGSDGPRASWRGSDLVCAARAGMVYVNGHPDAPPVAPAGLAAYAATGLVGAVAIALACRTRERTGLGVRLDLSVEAATASALEHVTALRRQTGLVQRRQGTLHWSRTFRVAEAKDGLVLLSHLSDWTTLSEWVVSEYPDSAELTDARWEDVQLRRDHVEHIFGLLDPWVAERTVEEVCEGAVLRRLLFTEVCRPESLAEDPQLVARDFIEPRRLGADVVGLPRPPWGRALGDRAARLPDPVGEDADGAARDWSEPRTSLRRAAKDTRARLPLDGVVVLDFTWVVAGPVATRVLADHGARIVKVEARNAADFGSRRGGLTGNLNRGKQSIVIDLETARGRELAHQLAERADAVIDNFSARVMEQWGLDYDALRARRSDAIQVRLTGYGLDGPARDRPSYGPTLQARTGYPYWMRLPDGPATGWGYSWSDMVGGWTGALATLAALRHRDETGDGQLVDLSQLESLVATMGPRVLDLLAGRAVEPAGNRSQEGLRTPQGIFRCAPKADDDDRWLALSIDDDAMWRRFADVLAQDGESWASDGDLERTEGRIAREDELEERLGVWARRFDAEALESRLQDTGVAAGLVASGADLAADPQLLHRGYFPAVEVSGEGTFEYDGIPFLSAVAPGRVAGPAPLCGEHTDSVLSELLGFGSEEIAELRAQEVIE